MPSPGAAQSDLAPAPVVPTPGTPLLRHAHLSQPNEVPTQSRASQLDRQKHFVSPPPASSSMTPPPSSQAPPASRPIARTPTPPTPQLSSPPPTVKPVAYNEDFASPSALFSTEQIRDATPEELRDMVSELNGALRDARTTAAHYKLQYSMLCMDSAESSNRMAVELAMAQREVDVLQQAEERRLNEALAPMQSCQEENAANATLLNEISRHCSLLQSENDELRTMLAQTRKAVEQREGEVAGLVEENERLRGRIRKNREHMNTLLDFMHDGTPNSLLATPLTTPHRRTHMRGAPTSAELRLRHQQPFEALLLADKVLNQETATAPSTPTRKQPSKYRFGRSRGSHSLSSLPATPNRRVRPRDAEAALPRTPLNQATVIPYPHTAPPAAQYTASTHRRASNDSTITASSIDAGDEAHPHPADQDVPESQASQAAASMLRLPPQSQKAGPVRASSGVLQSRILGHVRKAGVSRADGGEKRKMEEREGEVGLQQAKRGRVEGGVGLGLGIGGVE